MTQEQDERKKMTPLFGPAQARIKALDKGLQKTLESTIKRWLKKRIELLESLPDDTRGELDDAGLLQTPTPVLPQLGRGRVQKPVRTTPMRANGQPVVFDLEKDELQPIE